MLYTPKLKQILRENLIFYTIYFFIILDAKQKRNIENEKMIMTKSIIGMEQITPFTIFLFPLTDWFN